MGTILYIFFFSGGDTTTGDGRIEFTVPNQRLEFTVANQRLEFTASEP